MRKINFDGTKCKLLATVMTAALLGACSSDVTRFGDDPFSSPFKTRAAFDPVNTNSINRTKAAAQKPLEPVSNGAVSTQTLPPPSSPIIGSSKPLTTGSVGAANYPALAPVAARQPSVLGTSNGWSAVGGTPVTLQQGENINALSSRYGVPTSAILAVNGLSNVNQAQPGQQIMIPAYNAVQGAKAPASGPVASSVIQKAPQAMPAATAQAAPPIPSRAVAPAPVKVAANPARQVTPPLESEAEKRAAAKLKEMRAPKAKAKVEDDEDEDDKPVVPKKKAELEATKRADALKAEAAKKAEATKKAEAAKKVEEAKAKAEAEKTRAAKLAAARKAKVDDETVTTASIPETKVPAKTQPMPAKEPEKEAAAPAADASDASFRWPAKGRVISGFGARGTGGANDGINIALPEGTPVRAAEGGTVVHADDALKGYGKLVLIRHPNGFVSVYAHNGELNVKRGESVKRGQVIAKSGQSGNVTAPQLHFEIRKGATPVDPTKHLGE